MMKHNKDSDMNRQHSALSTFEVHWSFLWYQGHYAQTNILSIIVGCARVYSEIMCGEAVAFTVEEKMKHINISFLFHKNNNWFTKKFYRF